MSLIQRFRDRSTLSKLRQRIELDPYPRSYVEYCKLFVNRGRMDEAMEAAQEGLDRFPHSEDLRDLLRHTWRHTKSQAIEQLRASCASDPKTAEFRDLAAIYLECEEYDEALRIAEELTRRLPGRPDGALLQGEILTLRFYKDHVATDAQRAITILECILGDDDQHFEANLALAQLYVYLGVISKSLFCLYRAMDINPDDTEAQELYAEVIKLPLERSSESELLREAERTELSFESRHARAASKSRGISEERKKALKADLGRLSLVHGVTRAAFVTEDTTWIAEGGDSRIMENGETDPLCDIAKGFREAAAMSSKRIGIGAFQSSTLKAGDHTLQFHAVGKTVALVETNDPSRVDIVKNECVNFVASWLRKAEELVHA